MTITYYLTMFFMLVAAIFLLIYIAINISWIKNTLKRFDSYIDTNHPRFIRIYDDTKGTYDEVKVLSELVDSLDAKKNFIEGLEHGDRKET